MQSRTFTTSKGDVFTTTLTDEEAFDICAGLNNTFAQDMARVGRSGKIQPKQLAWAHKHAFDAKERQSKPANFAPKPTAQLPHSGLVELFRTATAQLTRPKITLSHNGLTVALAIAGDRSRYAGQLLVTDGGDFGNNVFDGRIDETGAFFGARGCRAGVVDFLAAFASDPAGVAAAHGKLTGKCCFCRLPLSDDRSTDVGYGKTCAKNWGLPWG